MAPFACVLALSVVAGLLLLGSPDAEGAPVTVSLYGTAAGGWSTSPGTETNPGPTLVVNLLDRVTMQFASEDAPVEHTFWIDYDRDGVVDLATEPNSPIFTSTITYAFDALVAGTFQYYCSIHSTPGLPGSPMRGTWITNGPPSATISSPTVGTSWTGGVAHEISFILADEDGPSALTVWVNYSYAGGSLGGSIVGPVAGGPNPSRVSWTPMGFSATDVVINVTARDGRGLFGYRQSAPFEVDSTPPAIASIVPAPGAAGVTRNTQVRVAWTEGMNRTATEAPASFGVLRVSDGVWLRGPRTWSGDSRLMTFTPSALLDALTSYEIHVNGTAKDDSEPGNPLGTAMVSQFTSGLVADAVPPVISSVAAFPATPALDGFVNLTAQVTDETALGSVSAHVVGPSLDMNFTMTMGQDSTWFVNRSYGTRGMYAFTVWAMDSSGNAASRSGSFVVRDIVAPAAPTFVSAVPRSDGAIVVTWDAVVAPDLVGYRVHRGGASGGPYTTLTAEPIPASAPKRFVDTAVEPGATYVYVVTAVDLDGNESPFSPEASVTVPVLRPDLFLWIVVAIAVGGVAAFIGFLFWRRRGRRPANSSDEIYK